MLSRADLNDTSRRLASVEAPTPIAASGDARQELFQRLSQIALGKQLTADVVSLFDDGTFLVKVEDAPARMALPNGTRVGDKLPLTLVAREPRPTFLLQQGESSAPATLSPAARLVDHILRQAQRDNAPAVLQPRAPLLPAPPANFEPGQLAEAMHGSLEFSGMFYESHLQQWASGARSLALLQREPQFQGGTLIQHANPAPHTAAATGGVQQTLSPATLVAQQAPGEPAPRHIQQLIRELQAQPGYAATAAVTDADVLRADGTAAVPSIEPEAAAMISLQLNALEQRQVQWQGELWPGQRFEWSISDETPQGKGQAAEDAGPVWSSRVRFTLPTLGEVTATLRLAGNQVQVMVQTEDETIAEALRAQAPLLANALGAAGSPLESLLVSSHGTP
jgi:hypothetical protein